MAGRLNRQGDGSRTGPAARTLGTASTTGLWLRIDSPDPVPRLARSIPLEPVLTDASRLAQPPSRPRQDQGPSHRG